VTSTPRGGSVFSLWIPRRVADEPADPVEEAG
jgi:hypothetical protein